MDFSQQRKQMKDQIFSNRTEFCPLCCCVPGRKDFLWLIAEVSHKRSQGGQSLSQVITTEIQTSMNVCCSSYFFSLYSPTS